MMQVIKELNNDLTSDYEASEGVSDISILYPSIYCTFNTSNCKFAYCKNLAKIEFWPRFWPEICYFRTLLLETSFK